MIFVVNVILFKPLFLTQFENNKLYIFPVCGLTINVTDSSLPIKIRHYNLFSLKKERSWRIQTKPNIDLTKFGKQTWKIFKIRDYLAVWTIAQGMMVFFWLSFLLQGRLLLFMQGQTPVYRFSSLLSAWVYFNFSVSNSK